MPSIPADHSAPCYSGPTVPLVLSGLAVPSAPPPNTGPPRPFGSAVWTGPAPLGNRPRRTDNPCSLPSSPGSGRLPRCSLFVMAQSLSHCPVLPLFCSGLHPLWPFPVSPLSLLFLHLSAMSRCMFCWMFSLLSLVLSGYVLYPK